MFPNEHRRVCVFPIVYVNLHLHVNIDHCSYARKEVNVLKCGVEYGPNSPMIEGGCKESRLRLNIYVYTKNRPVLIA